MIKITKTWILVAIELMIILTKFRIVDIGITKQNKWRMHSKFRNKRIDNNDNNNKNSSN